jgi:hypothetical protein
MHAYPPALPVHSDRPDLDTRLPALLGQTVGDVATGSRPAGRTAVRRRVALLRRRRRLRRMLGSSTLAAGMVAGGLPSRFDGHTSPVATAPATSAARRGAAPPTARAASPRAPAQPAISWSRDPGEGVDREAADPGALYADGGFRVYATSATHCGAPVATIGSLGSAAPRRPCRAGSWATPCPSGPTGWRPTTTSYGRRP